MRLEIRSAAHFLSDLLRLGHSLTDHQLDTFRGTLEDLLRRHYQHHWFPERPARGSGYRCIRINHKMDPLIANAAQACGVNDSGLLRNMFPNELTLWIDPREVSYRIGENGSICVLYELPPAVPVAPNPAVITSPDTLLLAPSPTSGSATTTANNRQSSNHNQHNGHHHHHHHQQQQHHHQNSSARFSSTCKDGARGLDNMIMDNHRNRNSIENHFTQYVSS